MKKTVLFWTLIFTFVLSTMLGNQAIFATTKPFPRTFVDDSGSKVTITKVPVRIVSLYPSATETVFGLGRGNRMVGRSDSCNYPKAALKLPIFGSYKSINYEQILKLKADLLLIHSSQFASNQSALKSLKKKGVQVVVIGDANNFADVYADIRLIGKAVGASKQASSLIQSMQKRLDRITEKAKSIPTPRKVYIEVDNYGGYWTTGRNTFMDEMLAKMNAINVAHDLNGWNAISSEKIVIYKPDTIIVTYGNYDKNAVSNMKNREGWATIPAIKNNKVFNVNGDLVSRPGPRLILGVEALAKTIYPNTFK